MALGDAKSGHHIDPTLRPDSRLAFRRPGRQTHGAHRTQGIIFAHASHPISARKPKIALVCPDNPAPVLRCLIAVGEGKLKLFLFLDIFEKQPLSGLSAVVPFKGKSFPQGLVPNCADSKILILGNHLIGPACAKLQCLDLAALFIGGFVGFNGRHSLYY